MFQWNPTSAVISKRDFICFSNEIKRNRDRILEINYYIDNQREEWTDMQLSITEAIDPETAALLGDEY